MRLEVGENKQDRKKWRQMGRKGKRERKEIDRGSGGEEKGSSCSSGGEVMRAALQQAELLQPGHNELSLTASPAAMHARTHTHKHKQTKRTNLLLCTDTYIFPDKQSVISPHVLQHSGLHFSTCIRLDISTY